MAKRKRHVEHVARYVKIEHWIMDTEAWRSLDCIARCAYVELKRRYAGPGTNNGRLPYSTREMSEELNVGKATASRAFHALQDRGFLVMTAKGAFSRKVRHASEWRLTEHYCDVTGNLPTKDFARWRAPQKQNAVSPEDPNGR